MFTRAPMRPFPLIWDWDRKPPASLVELVSVASQEVYSACGLNQALWGGSQAAAVREAWRLCLFGVLSPLGRLVEAELQEKLEDTVTLSWQELRASDLSGRARGLPVDGRGRYGGRQGRCRRWPDGGRLRDRYTDTGQLVHYR